MGARQSKRSVDITTTPKKEGISAEGGVVGDAAAPGDGKLERIEEAETKPTTNGIAPHTDAADDKEKDKDEATEKDKESQQPQEEEEAAAAAVAAAAAAKAEETKQESAGESPAETAEATTPTEATPASPNTVTSPDSKEAKKKDKKKKWSFRSISFSKKDKTKPSREETPKNGDVTKEEPLAEGGEEAENATANQSSPSAEEKSGASSPSADDEQQQVTAPAAASTAVETKEETTAAASPAATASPAEEKKEEPTPSAPTPVPSVEDKKEEAIEKIEAEKKVVEVSQSTGGQSVTGPVEVPVYRVQPVATSSIIERKTSEELPPLPPSSPPPTPIDPSPLQQARQAAASAIALAEALKLPAEAADDEESTLAAVADATSPSSREDFTTTTSTTTTTTTITTTTPSIASSIRPSADPTIVPARVEYPPVVETTIEFQDAKKVGEILAASSRDNEEAAEIAPKVENPVAMEQEAASGVEEALVAAEKPIDDKDARNEVECPFIPKEEGDSSGEKSLPVASISLESETRDQVTTTVPVVVSEVGRVENEMNSCADAIKTNVPFNGGFRGNLEAEAEIETNDACPALKQHLSSEKLHTENMDTAVSRHADTISSDENDVPTVDKCANVATEESLSSPIKVEGDYVPQAALTRNTKDDSVPLASATELFINSEEGPLSVSEDVLVEAVPAMVIPEDDSTEELTDTTESIVKMVPETDEERIENEPESDTALPTEETLLISEELEDMSVPEEPSLNEPAIVVVPSIAKDEAKALEDTSLPSPPPQDSVNWQTPELQDTMSESIVEESTIGTEGTTNEGISEICDDYSPKDRVTGPDSSHSETATQLSDAPTCTPSETSSEPSTCVNFPKPLALSEIPTSPNVQPFEESSDSDYPPPQEPCAAPISPVIESPLPPSSPVVSVEDVASPRKPTETLLVAPVSPSSHDSSVDIASSDIATNQSLTMTNTCDRSDVESKECLAAENPAKTESQGALLCQLSNTIPLTAAKEQHQNAPEAEAPVENVSHDSSATESADEAPKVAPPAIPTEAPATPPTAPAITEDVASVTKAIEEIDISDKAVAAAVNEAIECNTNEIIADAHHQNNLNE